jgi:hypothetical protein
VKTEPASANRRRSPFAAGVERNGRGDYLQVCPGLESGPVQRIERTKNPEHICTLSGTAS